MTQARGYTIFCDDIRTEVGNKPSLMGIYTGRLVVFSDFPFQLPKLCLWIRYEEPVDAVWHPLTVQVYVPGKEEAIFTFEYPLKDARAAVAAPPTPFGPPRDSERLHIFYIPLALSPFVIDQEGWIRVRGHYDSEVLRLGSLAVTRQTPST
jgi:hypothetical protein